MTTAGPRRLSPQDVRRRLQSGAPAFLVCAYEDEAKFRRVQLEGAISFLGLQSRLPSLPKDQEIVFY